MKLICPHCSKETHLAQEHPYHAGFSNQGFLYCDSSPGTLVFGSYNRKYVRIVGDKHPWMMSQEEKHKVEAQLNPCPCGGRFSFDAYPRCPHCGGDLQGLLPDKMHFILIGDIVDADRDEEAWRKS